MLKIYAAGPMSGLTVSQIKERYERVLLDLGADYQVFHPMIDHSAFECKTADDNFVVEPRSEAQVQRSFFGRDKWMVTSCDVLFADFTQDTGKVSIGTMMEIAWAHLLGKYVVLVMPPGNTHEHAFVDQAADTVFADYDSAVRYLLKLAHSKF